MARNWLPQVIASVMLLIALSPKNSYGYYDLLRWVCFAVFAWVSFGAKERRQYGWAWTLGFTAAIFNPFIPLHLDRDLWSLIDLGAIGVAVGSILFVTMKETAVEVEVVEEAPAPPRQVVEAAVVPPEVPIVVTLVEEPTRPQPRVAKPAPSRPARDEELHPQLRFGPPALSFAETGMMMFAVSCGWAISMNVLLGMIVFVLSGFKTLSDDQFMAIATIAIPLGVYCAGVQVAWGNQKECESLKLMCNHWMRQRPSQ